MSKIKTYTIVDKTTGQFVILHNGYVYLSTEECHVFCSEREAKEHIISIKIASGNEFTPTVSPNWTNG